MSNVNVTSENSSNKSIPNSESKKGGNGKFVVLIILLLLAVGSSVFLLFQNGELKQEVRQCGDQKEKIDTDRQQIISQLNSLSIQYDTLSTSNELLSADLMHEKERVLKLIEQAKDNKWSIRKLRKEAETLRQIMQGYVHTIDSLNTLNVNLMAENTDIKGQLDETTNKYTNLEQKAVDLESKVALGSRLQSSDIIAIAQRVKSNGIHRETTKGDKTDVIKCCLTISDNPIAKPGKRMVYIRIISPFGAVLADDKDNRFDFNGVKGRYSIKKEIEYTGEKQDLCIYYESNNTVSPGDYLVTVYVDGYELGNTKLSLK